MNRIYPINEFLGVATYLDNLALKVIDKIEDNFDKPVKTKVRGVDVIIKSACQIKLPIRNQIVTINIQYGNRQIDGYGAFVQVENLENFEFNLYTSLLQLPAIIHELKHIDRIVARKFKTRDYYYINHVGRHLLNHIKDELFFGPESKELLQKTFYFLDPEEFEAHYNEIYQVLKVKINADMSNDETKKFISKFLKNQQVYKYYKFYYKEGEFEIDRFFKNRASCNRFLEMFLQKLDEFDAESDKYYDEWSMNEKEIENIDEIELNSLSKEINHLLTKQTVKGYKKFARLYAIFTK